MQAGFAGPAVSQTRQTPPLPPCSLPRFLEPHNPRNKLGLRSLRLARARRATARVCDHQSCRPKHAIPGRSGDALRLPSQVSSVTMSTRCCQWLTNTARLPLRPREPELTAHGWPVPTSDALDQQLSACYLTSSFPCGLCEPEKNPDLIRLHWP